jgi:hypothetical protein
MRKQILSIEQTAESYQIQIWEGDKIRTVITADPARVLKVVALAITDRENGRMELKGLKPVYEIQDPLFDDIEPQVRVIGYVRDTLESPEAAENEP